MPLMRAGLSLASPAGSRGRLSVLIFHRVLAEQDPLFPDEMFAARFDAMCGWLKRDFNVLPLDVAAARLREGRLPTRACAITFDDGYADNLHIAAPILQAHGLSATFFIATGFLDGGRMWNDTVIEVLRRCRADGLDLTSLDLGTHATGSVTERRRAIDSIIGAIKYLPVDARLVKTQALTDAAGVAPPDDLMLSSDELRRLHQCGMVIGAHTVSHPILARLDIDVAHREIDEGRRALEALLGERIGLFAYPNGKPGTDYLPEHARMVREMGFDAAVSTTWGASNAATDPYQLLRFTPWDQSHARFNLRMMANLMGRH